MSRSRQTIEAQVRAMSVAWASAYTWRDRSSEWGQLLFAARGMLTVHTAAGLWVVPAHQAVWVPAGVRHSVEIAGGIAMRAVYLHDSLGRTRRARLPGSCRIVELSSLLREVLRRTLRLQALDRRVAAQRHLQDVLLDELTLLPLLPLDLPTPRDARAARVAALIRAEPSAPHTLAAVARAAAASARTLERLFREETGLPFGVWRQRARLLRALQLLAEGSTVAATAGAVGYESPSAFVAAFRRALGTTPGRYFKQGAGEEEEKEEAEQGAGEEEEKEEAEQGAGEEEEEEAEQAEEEAERGASEEEAAEQDEEEAEQDEEEKEEAEQGAGEEEEEAEQDEEEAERGAGEEEEAEQGEEEAEQGAGEEEEV
jgi:AraC-like DNA-binding protein